VGGGQGRPWPSVSRYRVEIARRAIKGLGGLPVRKQQRIRAAIDLLADDPRPPECTKLTGEDDTYRVRIDVYRMIYEIFEDRLVIRAVRIRHRRDNYRE
jgi:mRNA interferase RelE/StbE